MIQYKNMVLQTIILTILCCLVNTGYGLEAYTKAIQSVIQLPNKLILKDYIFTDVNNDGLKDLILSVGNSKKRFARSLRIHYQQQTGQTFILEPDFILPLTADVVAYACADIDPSPGAEIMLLTGKACFGYRLQKDKKNNLFKIMELQFLWQLPDPYHVFSWQNALIDVNGDKKVDLLLPQSNALRILIQKKAKFSSTPLFQLPKGKINKALRIYSSDNNATSGLDGFVSKWVKNGNRKPLVNISHSVRVPLFDDFNGDELTDVIMHTSTHLYVWTQKIDGLFSKKPISLRLPSNSSESGSGLDSSSNQFVLDINNDKRCDFIMFSRGQNREKVLTQILIYINQFTQGDSCNLFAKDGIPQQLLKIAGLPINVSFTDINSDGFPDISFILFNPDLLNQVKTVALKTIKFEFLAFISNKGQFPRTPDITQEIYISLEEQAKSYSKRGRFFIDFNGDGLLDLIVLDSQKQIGLHLLKKNNNGIVIEKGTVWDMAIPEKTRIVYEATQKDKSPVLMLLDSNQLTYVRFK